MPASEAGSRNMEPPTNSPAEEHTSRRVGFIGLGQMGRPLAGRLLEVGYDLVVWNRTRERAEAIAAGHPGRVSIAESAAAVGAATDRLALCLLDDVAVEAVMEGPQGVLAALGPGAVVLNFTTCRPETSRRMALRASEQGAGHLDSPFSGLPHHAARGALTLMVGGAPDHVAAARDLLDQCGSRVFHLGPPGAGSLTKILNNGLAATCLAASGEALTAARAAGLDPALFVEALLASSGGSNLLGRMKSSVLAPARGAVEETFTLRRFREYTRLAAEVEAHDGLLPTLVEAADTLLMRCIAAGYGEDHYTAFVLALAALAGHTRTR
jgi:3-hydroxyisobutyrate dehydrogenase-like beta-hydroxyacid dehydrogenase